MRQSAPIGPRSTGGGRRRHTSSCATSATAAVTCTRGSSATRTCSRAGWPQSSPSTPPTGASTTPRSTRDRVAHRRLPHQRPGDRSRPASRSSSGTRRGPAAAAVQDGSRAVRPRARGHAQRAARRTGRRRPGSRALRDRRASSGAGSRARDRPTISGYAPRNLTQERTRRWEPIGARRVAIRRRRPPRTARNRVGSLRNRERGVEPQTLYLKVRASHAERARQAGPTGRRHISRSLSRGRSNCSRPDAGASWRSTSRRSRLWASTSPSSSRPRVRRLD